jgi:hypothetical protein
MAQTTQNYLGRCKECEYVIFATSEDVQQAEGFREVTAGTGVYRVGNNGCFARCTNRHKVFPCKLVKGTYSEAHQCDARCLNAKGNDCTCSCGGANHGRGHVATVTQASELPGRTQGSVRDALVRRAVETDPSLTPARPLGRHLGEVGKHIKGEVKIARVLKLVNSMLYKFITEAGDNIDWFVPHTYDPGWDEGRTLTIRAKVIRHESHERFGNSTVVIYVEEVE